MLVADFLKLTGSSLIAHRLRSFLTTLGIAVGIAAVVLLTSIGEGVHQFVLSEFSQFGTNLVGINPGKATTAGGSMGMFGTERPLSIADAEALKRLSSTRAVVPVVVGNAEVEAGNRRRRTTVYGVGPEMPQAFSMEVKLGRFLPADDPTAPRAFAVLGSKVRKELFGDRNPLGQRITHRRQPLSDHRRDAVEGDLSRLRSGRYGVHPHHPGHEPVQHRIPVRDRPDL